VRISEIEVVNLYARYPDGKGFRYAGGQVTGRVSTVVRVITENGIVGLGASYAYPDIVRIIINNHLKPHLLGCDPREVERLWEQMYSLTRWYGRKGAAMSALGALDIAFWDLRAKSIGKPLYAVLGGTRGNVPAYASGLFWQDDVRRLQDEAERYRNLGFRRVKTRLGHSESYDVAALQAIRQGVGRDGDILVDGSHRYTLETAEKIGRVLEREKVFWFEEPFPPEDIDSYCALRGKLKLPLAAGENDFGLQGFREMLRAGALGVAQPDACRAGGITECLRIGRMAAEMGVPIGTHTWSDAVALIANAHFVAAIPNGLTVEIDQTGNPFIDALLREPLEIRDGLLQLPEGPGLGIELDEQVLQSLALPAAKMIPDGNYSDLVFGREYYSSAPPYQAD
jgi:D-galactarolactone cycloisomerase